MTTAIATWGGDPMPDAVTISSEGRGPVLLSPVGARRLTDDIRAHLTGAIVKLGQAREGGADQVLGYPSWHAYVEAEFGDLRELRLPKVERVALEQSMHDDGLSYRQIRDKLGVSLGQIRNDIGAPSAESANVVQLHDPEPDPYEGMTRTDEALARVRAQGSRGLTSIELDHETGWPLGTATASLCRLERRGLVARVPRFRHNRAAYVATELTR